MPVAAASDVLDGPPAAPAETAGSDWLPGLSPDPAASPGAASAEPAQAAGSAAGLAPGAGGEVPLLAAAATGDAVQAVPVPAVDLAARRRERAMRAAYWRAEIIAWFKTVASAAVYATLIVTFGFQVARVEGLSMAPTLQDQDRLIVNKLIYRWESPRRGDVVMLYYPLNPDKSFVKRVIAEEFDTVRIVDGRVYVNDVPMKDDFVPPEYRSHDDWGPQQIPEGYYFVMGDHRNNSSDSRHWGMVPKKYIIGKVQLRWWPLPQARIF